MPSEICSLTSLRQLHLYNSTRLYANYTNGTTKPDECLRSLKLLVLKMDFNSPSMFPDLVKCFPNLDTLDLTYNALEFIKNDSFQINSFLTDLDLSNNRFKGIPTAIKSLMNLRALS